VRLLPVPLFAFRFAVAIIRLVPRSELVICHRWHAIARAWVNLFAYSRKG